MRGPEDGLAMREPLDGSFAKKASDTDLAQARSGREDAAKVPLARLVPIGSVLRCPVINFAPLHFATTMPRRGTFVKPLRITPRLRLWHSPATGRSLPMTGKRPKRSNDLPTRPTHPPPAARRPPGRGDSGAWQAQVGLHAVKAVGRHCRRSAPVRYALFRDSDPAGIADRSAGSRAWRYCPQ